MNSNPVTPAKLSTEATPAGYLLEAGWKLHLSANPADGHSLFRSTTVDSTTRVDKCQVSADCVLALQQAGKLKRLRQFTVNNQTTTVFESATEQR